jgi:hypothetical protein
VAVGHVQQADVAEARQVVQLGGALLGQRQFAVQDMPPAAATAMT